MKQKVKKEVTQYVDFLTDIAKVMEKHKVNNLIVICGFNGEIRNTYMPANGEEEIYCNISDGIDEWLKQIGHTVSRKSEFEKTESQQ